MSINNNITIKGKIGDTIDFAYAYDSHNFFKFVLSNTRKSGTTDDLNVIADNDLISLDIVPGAMVEVVGEIRTRNITDNDGDKKHLQVYVFAKSISICGSSDSDDMNDIALIGYICRQPSLRTTPLGKTVCDFMLAVQRQTPKRSDYIPCIAWGDRAKDVSEFRIGAKIAVYGRMQSRVYHKNTDPRTVYELSVIDYRSM